MYNFEMGETSEIDFDLDKMIKNGTKQMTITNKKGNVDIRKLYKKMRNQKKELRRLNAMTKYANRGRIFFKGKGGNNNNELR